MRNYPNEQNQLRLAELKTDTDISSFYVGK